MEKRVELLAPCGSYESFLAAVAAGADAVYLGGRRFGARAYAENFSDEELIRVIREAHLSHVKVYLTVNTLVKEREFPEIYEYMLPLYEAGLDGAIIQDMGVLCFLRKNFPGLKLHASTQMTITGVCGAAYLKEMGCERIVPARELSLEEIREIRRKVPIEIETFIHGAMCYCYSGQCLMSSMIGGRSGNRGRCAGPCRLPYRAAGKEGYYLSLKDMNTIALLPKLIEAGVTSFKIEGRMKRAEYVAGVVSVYRKYIDAYYGKTGRNGYGSHDTKLEKKNEFGYEKQLMKLKSEDKLSHKMNRKEHQNFSVDSKFRVEEKDAKLLSELYIRSETGIGYYGKRNGRDMLTLHKPGYNEADQALLEQLREKYIHELPRMEVRIFARCKVGEPLYGEIRFTDRVSGKEVCLSVSGAEAEKADKRGVSEEEIRRQLVKTGGTPFAVKECTVEVCGDVFVPMSMVKELRRALVQKIYEYYGARDLKSAKRRESIAAAVCREEEADYAETGSGKNSNVEENGNEKKCTIVKTGSEWECNITKEDYENRQCTLTILVQTKEQFKAVFSAIENRSATEAAYKQTEKIEEYLIVDADLFMEDAEIRNVLSDGEIHWGLKCPVILRKSDEKFLQKLQAAIEEKKPEIIYCATIDALAWVKSISYTGKIAGEASLYAWNREAVSHWGLELERVSIPLELDSKEIRELCVAGLGVDYAGQMKDEIPTGKTAGVSDFIKQQNMASSQYVRLEAPVYGRAPFMVTANCIKLTTGKCDKDRHRYTELTDRLGNTFPVYTNCSHCYNIIYNCLPTSYEDGLWMLVQDGIRAFRVEFTTESSAEAEAVLQTFRRRLASELLEEDDGNAVGQCKAMNTDKRIPKPHHTKRTAKRISESQNTKSTAKRISESQNTKSTAKRISESQNTKTTGKNAPGQNNTKGAPGQEKGKTAGVEITQGRFRRSVE